MPKRPNYRQERAERNRSKQARQLEKLQKKSEDAARRKALKADDGMPEPEAGEPDAKDRP